MKAPRTFVAWAAALAVLGCTAVGQVPETARFGAAQLEQLAAPIALYPDSLLSHVLMASTYPIEVIEAERFVRANPTLGGDALRNTVADRSWDPSVKALIGMPDLLKMMSENLDWMRDLGDAFLVQKAELLDAVQRLRARARNEGTLSTTQQQTVKTQESGITVIESSSPDVIYVPTYSPCVVYGPSWTYPYWYYPGFYGPGYWPYGSGWGVGFSFGFNWGGWLWGGLSWGWGASDLWVWGPRYDYFNYYWHHGDGHHGGGGHGSGNHGGGGQGGGQQGGNGWSKWAHSPDHRSGVRYRDASTARKYGVPDDSLVPRKESRGFPGSISPPAAARGVSKAPTNHVDPRQIQPKQGGVIRQPDRGDVKTPIPGRSWSGSRNPGLDNRSIDRGTRSRGLSPSGGGRGGGVSPKSGGGGRGGGSFNQGGKSGKGH